MACTMSLSSRYVQQIPRDSLDGAQGSPATLGQGMGDRPRADGRRQRNLNNAFAYDLVPSTGVIVAALKAARRVNDFPTAVRIFEGMSSPLSSSHYQFHSFPLSVNGR